MKNALSAAMVLIGTFIGAGFASGQEVIQYFGIFGNYGVVGILISCLLLSALHLHDRLLDRELRLSKPQQPHL